MSTLRLTYAPEDEWHGKLQATIEGEGFAGTGSAWFRADQLREFCDRLGEYPLRTEELPVLEGGYWNADESLGQVHLSIRIAPHNPGGALRVSVVVAEPVEADDDLDRLRLARNWFVVGYNDLTRFQSGVRRLLTGELHEAVLAPQAA
jgi:hypothetical protein